MEYMEYMDTLAHHLGTWNIFNYFSRYIHGTYMDIHGTRIFNLAMQPSSRFEANGQRIGTIPYDFLLGMTQERRMHDGD